MGGCRCGEVAPRQRRLSALAAGGVCVAASPRQGDTPVVYPPAGRLRSEGTVKLPLRITGATADGRTGWPLPPSKDASSNRWPHFPTRSTGTRPGGDTSPVRSPIVGYLPPRVD